MDRSVVDVDDVVPVVADVDPGVGVDVVVEGETGVAGEMIAGVCGPRLDVVDVVDVVGAGPLSAETHPEGGVEAPPWPGISTVPAHPKFEKWASSVTVPPPVKVTVEADSRMNPDPSMETTSLMVR